MTGPESRFDAGNPAMERRQPGAAPTPSGAATLRGPARRGSAAQNQNGMNIAASEKQRLP